MKKKLTLLLLAALTGPALTLAQPAAKSKASLAPTAPAGADPAPTYAATITQDDLRRHLTVLASEAFQGRETGEKGQKLAADYLAKQFAALGLQGPVRNSDNPYLQHFQLTRDSYAPGGFLKVNGQAFEWLTDFFSYGPMPSAFPVETAGKPVFAGFGIEQPNYADYAGLDVKDKDVLVMMGEPEDAHGRFLLTGSRKASPWASGLKKIAVAKQKGARSIFFVSFGSNTDFQEQAVQLEATLKEPVFVLPDPGPEVADARPDDEELPSGIGVYIVSPALGQRLTGATSESLQAYVDAIGRTGKPAHATFQPAPFTIYIPQLAQQLTTENVVGFLEGSDKKSEALVISAHFDHLGVKHDTIYNGADDDGSGTVSMLEIAQAFAKAKAEGHGPRRSILFIAMTGEEEGLFGSQYYTGHPLIPLENTVADLNIDMVGRTDKKHEGRKTSLYVIGADKLSSELNLINEAANRKYSQLDLDYTYNSPDDPEQLYYRSDHYNFAKHKIPVAFFTSGLHQDYHKATDDVEKIEFGPLEKRARLVFYTAWELANRDQRIVVDSNKP